MWIIWRRRLISSGSITKQSCRKEFNLYICKSWLLRKEEEKEVIINFKQYYELKTGLYKC